ncbi:MAG TPA: peptidyl-prolyl cis-trans isomerase [bacterium]|nr:peptidyl-prolyl cis-trans isomerase [bacterium]
MKAPRWAGLALALGLAGCRPAPQELPLVRVNGEAITPSQLREEQAFLGDAAPGQDEALDSLVDQALILQEAKRLGLKLSDDDRKNAEALALAGTDEGLLEASLKAQGLTLAAWRERLDRAALADATVQADVRSHLEVGRQEVQDHYWEHITAYRSPARRVLRQIYTRRRNEAESAERQLDLGEPFSQVAKAQGQGPEAADGGLLGPEAASELPKSLGRAVADLKPGQRSAILASHWGYHILLCESVQPAVSLSLEEAAPRAQATLLRDKERDLYRAWLARLRESAVIERLNPLPAPAPASSRPQGAP